jgi:phosphotransferase system HPr-like phosphotransfer protein
MMTAEITLTAGRKFDALVTAKIAKKCRECKSKVCISRGDVHDADGRSLHELHSLGNVQDPHLTLMVMGNDEFRVMCDLVDLINHAALEK